jgi:hypothetical protein
VYFVLDRNTPGGLTGGSTPGLWFGISGSALMVYAGLLAFLKRVPAWWWIGSRQTWLRGHIWMSLLSVVLILCHSGFRLGGPLEQVLMLLFFLTILTGLFGLALQHILPRTLTLRVPSEAPYEQIPHMCRVMRTKGDEILVAVFTANPSEQQASIMLSQQGFGAKLQLQEFYDKQVRPFFSAEYQRRSFLANPLQAQAAFDRLRALPGLADVKDQVSELETLCEERRQLATQERLHSWLHSWLLVHIPLSVALLVVGVVHVWFSLKY